MARFLFVTWDGGGNVPPVLDLATEVQDRGHEVRVLAHPQQEATVTAAGLRFRPYREARPFRSTEWHSLPQHIALFGDPGMGRDVTSALAEEPADVLVVDCLLYGALAAARESGLPYVVVEHLFDAYLEKKWLRGPLGLGMRVKRLAPRRSLDEAALRIVASLPELDPTGGRDGTGNLVWSGPTTTGVPAAPDRPTVLVSLSTYAFPGQTRTMQNVLDACGGLDDVHVIATTGPVIDPDDLRPAGNTEVHRWLPHAEVLPQVSLVIGHGGHATTMAALAHDIPLLVLPSHPMLDQPMVGAAVEAYGAGRSLSRKAKPQQIKTAVVALLEDGPHRAAAGRLGASIRHHSGAVRAADLVEGVVADAARRTVGG